MTKHTSKKNMSKTHIKILNSDRYADKRKNQHIWTILVDKAIPKTTVDKTTKLRNKINDNIETENQTQNDKK